MAESKELFTNPEETPLNEKKEPDLQQKNKEKSFTEKLVEMKKNITVEPMLAGFVIPSAMTCIAIFSKKLQIDDALLCLISIASKFVGSVWTAFAKSDWEIYMIPVAELLTGTTFTSLRSIMSKLIDQNETAKVNSLFSLTETLASLIFQPFYSWLYMNTLQVMPGAVFLTSASLIVPASFILTDDSEKLWYGDEDICSLELS
ncbi:unnamed protein product [Danaus chrysippus]|uniref:(African queen) hypothetical protein n=1 Tax=Danaus chrysippus TaxID=151541 RepID=A0A8J2QD87_9NEOP|nr:unnamed protein product [Danaus chrysippus]